jgi:translocation and assembly module TamB
MKLSARISWPVRIVAAVFVMLLVTYLGVVFVMSTAWSHHWMARMVAAKIEQITGARTEIAWLDVHPAVFRVILHGLVLRGTEAAPQKPLLTVGTIDVTMNPLVLVTGGFYIRRVDVTGLTIRLETTPSGGTNLPGPSEATKREASQMLSDLLNLRIRNFSLSRSAVYWNNQMMRLDLAATNLAILLKFDHTHEYIGSFSSSHITCRLDGRVLPTLTVATRIIIAAHQIELHDAVWRALGGSGAANATVKLTNPLSGEFEMIGRADLAPFARALNVSILRQGDLRFSARGTYDHDLLHASGHVAARGLLAELGEFNPGAVDASANFRLDQDHLSLSRISAALMDGEARGDAVAVLTAAPRIKFQGTVQRIDLAAFVRAIPGGGTALNLFDLDTGLSGDLGFSYDERAGGFRADFAVKGRSQNVAPGNFMPVNGSASGSVIIGKDFQLQIASLNMKTLHSALDAQGLLSTTASHFQFRYVTDDFEESRKFIQFLEAPKAPFPLVLQSQARFSGTLDGSVLQPEVHGEMSCGRFSYAGYPWNGFSGAVTFASSLSEVSGGRLLAGESSFAFNLKATLANWQVTPSSQIKASVEARQTPMEGIRDALALSYPVSGVMDGSVSFEGTPDNLEGRGQIEIQRAQVEGEPVDMIMIQVVIANSVLDFTKFVLNKGKGTLTGSGRVDLVHHNFSGEVHGKNFQLADFRSLGPPTRANAGQNALRSLAGTVEIRVQGSGRFSNPEIEAHVGIPDLRIAEAAVGSFELDSTLKAKTARASATLAGKQGSVALIAKAQLEGEWPMQFSGKLDKFRVDTPINWVEGLASRAEVTTSGEIAGHGSLRKPSTLVMDAHIKELNAGTGSVNWTNRQTIHLTYADRKLSADSFGLKGPSTDIQLGGWVRLAHPVEVDFQANGHSEASIFNLFDPSIQAAGTFDAHLRVRGTLANPQLSGALDVKDLGLGYTNFPFQVAGLNGRIELQGNHADIVSLGSQSGQSSIQLKGFVAFGANSRYDLTASLSRARLGFPTDFTSLLSGNLELSGTERGGQLSGSIAVTQMFARSNFNLLSWLGRLGSPTPLEPSVSNPLASRIRLNIALSTTPDVSLQSHDLSFVAVIDANLQGTVSDPVVLGTIHLRSGDALIRGNRYKITRGDITMTNPVRTQPILDLAATTRIAHYDLTLDVEGPLDRAKIAYRSDPPLPTEAILSLLALGYAPQLQQLNTAGSQQTAAVGASALLSQALSSQFSGRVQQLLGVSRIRIDPNLIGPTTAGGARVTIEEQVRPDVTLTYATNTGAAQQRDIRLEWDLSDRISLIAEQDINGVYGVELRFRHRFK